MWGAIIAAAASLISQGIGMAQSAKAKKEADAKREALQQENENWFNRRYNEDPLQRSSAQRVLTRMTEDMRKRNKAAAGRAAVMGGTEESVAAEKARSTEAMAEAASRIAAQGDAEKDRIEEQYRAAKSGLAQQQIAANLQQAQNVAQATAAAGQAIGKAGLAADGYLDKGGSSMTTEEAKALGGEAEKLKLEADKRSLKNFGTTNGRNY